MRCGFTKLIIRHTIHKIKRLFDVIVDGNKVSRTKPDPEVFVTGAKELNVKPEKCVVFKDAEAGIQAAKAAGMYAVGIGRTDNFMYADFVIIGLHCLNINKMINYDIKLWLV